VICAANYLVSPRSGSRCRLRSISISALSELQPFLRTVAVGQRWQSLPSACLTPAPCRPITKRSSFLSPVTPASQASSHSNGRGLSSENGVSRQAVPLTLNYSGPGNLSGNAPPPLQARALPSPACPFDTVGGGTLSTTSLLPAPRISMPRQTLEFCPRCYLAGQ